MRKVKWAPWDQRKETKNSWFNWLSRKKDLARKFFNSNIVLFRYLFSPNVVIKDVIESQKKSIVKSLTNYRVDFTEITGYLIKSPISGKITKISFNKNSLFLSIVNFVNLQLFISISIDSSNVLVESGQFFYKLKKKVNQSIWAGEVIVSFDHNFFIKGVMITVPWQPSLIEVKEKDIYYTNPFKKQEMFPWSKQKVIITK